METKEHYKQEIIKTADLNLFDNNPRTHSQEQIAQLINSIKSFGFTNPLLIDEDKMVIAGHGRLEAAIALEMESVPCVLLTNLTELQKVELVIADNQLALNAGWDSELLKLNIELLQEMGSDLEILGFDDGEIDLILDGWESDIDIPETSAADDGMFKIIVTGVELDVDGVLSTLNKAIDESGINGVSIAKA
jgi:ParB-like chromosome segregation protein Spo0J